MKVVNNGEIVSYINTRKEEAKWFLDVGSFSYGLAMAASLKGYTHLHCSFRCALLLPFSLIFYVALILVLKQWRQHVGDSHEYAKVFVVRYDTEMGLSLCLSFATYYNVPAIAFPFVSINFVTKAFFFSLIL